MFSIFDICSRFERSITFHYNYSMCLKFVSLIGIVFKNSNAVFFEYVYRTNQSERPPPREQSPPLPE